jgi:hypothetical protein
MAGASPWGAGLFFLADVSAGQLTLAAWLDHEFQIICSQFQCAWNCPPFRHVPDAGAFMNLRTLGHDKL